MKGQRFITMLLVGLLLSALPSISSAAEKQEDEPIDVGDGVPIFPRRLPALSKKPFVFTPIQVLDSEGKTHSLDQVAFREPSAASPAARWALASTVSLDGKLFISLSEAMKASKPGSTIQIGPGSAYLPTLTVRPELPSEGTDIRRITLGQNTHSYSEVYLSRRPVWIQQATLNGVTILGAAEPSALDTRYLMTIGPFKQGRGVLQRFMDSSITKDQRTLQVPTIRTLEPTVDGFSLDRANVSLAKGGKDAVLPAPASVIRVEWHAPLVFSGSKNVKIKNIGFVGAASVILGYVDFASSDPLIYIANAENIEIENCALVNSTGIGALIVNSKNIRFKNCVFGASIRDAVVAINSEVSFVNSSFVGNGRGWRKESNTSVEVIEPGNAVVAFSSLIMMSGGYFKGTGGNPIVIDEDSDLIARDSVLDEDLGITFLDCSRRASKVVRNIARGRVVDGEALINFFSLRRHLVKEAESKNACVNLDDESNRRGEGKLDIDGAISLLSTAVDFSDSERQQAYLAYQEARQQYRELRHPEVKIWRAFMTCAAEQIIGEEITDPVTASIVSQLVSSRLEARSSAGDVTEDIMQTVVIEALREAGYEKTAKAVQFGFFLKCVNDRS